MENKHTPTPWKAIDGRLYDADNNEFGGEDGFTQKEAVRIVRSVNSHEELLDIICRLWPNVSCASMCPGRGGSLKKCDCGAMKAIEDACNVLSKAEARQ